MVDYKKRSDKALAKLAQAGDKRAELELIKRYEYLAEVKARSYFLWGGEHKDLVQEGMIGLYKAIRDYKEEASCSFSSFAIICITRQIITAVKTYSRKKHTPLSSYQSLDERSDDLLDTLDLQSVNNHMISDPLDLLLAKEEVDTVIAVLKDKLSELEWEVFVYHLSGKSYQETADILDCHWKVVDNALCRIRMKLKEYLESRGYRVGEAKKLKLVKPRRKKSSVGSTIYAFHFYQSVHKMTQNAAQESWRKLSKEEKSWWLAKAVEARYGIKVALPKSLISTINGFNFFKRTQGMTEKYAQESWAKLTDNEKGEWLARAVAELYELDFIPKPKEKTESPEAVQPLEVR